MKRKLLILSMAFFAFASCQEAKHKVLELAAQKANEQCPMIIDEVTQMDSTSYDATTNTFSYYYTLSGVADDPSMIEKMKSEMETTIPETIKQTEEMKMFSEMDVTMDYIYLSGKTKEELFLIKVTPEQYK